MGSFVNALVWRLHEQSKLKAKNQQKKYKVHNTKYLAKNYVLSTKNSSKLSILSGRSMCPNCRHALAWHDLLPIISWAILKGHCRHCKKPISIQYPVVELATAGLFAISYLAWPKPFFSSASVVDLAFWLAICVVLMALFVYDLKWMILPNRLIYPLILLSLVNVIVVYSMGGNLKALVWPFLGAAILFSLFYVLFQISGGRWIGGGDVKLAPALGLLAGGVRLSFAALFIASLIGTIYALPLMVAGKAKMTMKLPFGPLLIIGLVVVKLYGIDILAWFDQVFLVS